jgi:hypothetical protein
MFKCVTMALYAGIVGATVVSPAVSALAGDPCPNGQVRNSRGHCVESELSARMRQRAIEMSQQKASETAAPVSPGHDQSSVKASDVNRYELNKGNFSTNPNPPSH